MKIKYPGRELYTDRLVLRGARIADAKYLWEYIYKDYYYHLLYYQIPYQNINSLRKDLFINQIQYMNGPNCYWVFCPKDSINIPMGTIEIGPDRVNNLCWMAWIIGKPFAKQGYTFEAAQRVVKYVFEDIGFHRIETKIVTDNSDSIQLAEKLGMKVEGICKDSWWLPSGYRDQYTYGLLNEHKRII